MCLLENLGPNRGEVALTFYVRQLRELKLIRSSTGLPAQTGDEW